MTSWNRFVRDWKRYCSARVAQLIEHDLGKIGVSSLILLMGSKKKGSIILKNGKAQTLYVKKGKKFVAVGKDDLVHPYGVGDYLVRVRRGGTSIRATRAKIPLDEAKLELAMDSVIDALATSISNHSKAQPQSRLHTPKEQKAFKAYQEIMGKDAMLTLSVDSANDIARKSLFVLRESFRRYDDPKCPDDCSEPVAERKTT